MKRQFKKIKTLLVACIILAPMTAFAIPITIDFDSITAQDSPFDYVEDGFTVRSISNFSAQSGSYIYSKFSGVDHEMEVTFAGGPFVWSNVFLRKGLTDLDVTIEGFLGAASQGTDVFNVLGNINFSSINLAGVTIDRLRFTAPAVFDVPLIVDNIVFDTNEVPEPGSVTLLLAGLAGFAISRRKRK